jgi:putative PIN family toxin of toxin-antitoxin system
MITLVLDTNVLVSALLSPHSHSAQIVRLVADGSIRVVFDERILAEYREVLSRPKFPFHKDQIESLLSQVEEEGLKIIPQPTSLNLPDPDDIPFLEVALAGKVDFLVTGNKKHYPGRLTHGVRVVLPRKCLEEISR